MSIKRTKPYRVLHCPVVALYQPYLYVKGLREMGVEADYMVFNFAGSEWLARSCDFDLGLDGKTGLQIEKGRELDFFHRALNHYDVFHFHSGFGLLNPAYSLYGRLSELSYLKKLEKKIVMSWWGCDLRTDTVDIVHKFSACNECEASIRAYCSTSMEKKEAINKAFLYCDIHLSSGDLVASYPGVKWVDNAIDCDEWKPLRFDQIPSEYRLKPTDNLRIYHSFGNSSIRGDVKGTKEIIAAVEQLKQAGYKVELMFFDHVPNSVLKYYQAQADIVVDQLKSGWYGATAVECMAMGKPVITYVRPEVKTIVPHEFPVIEANPNNIHQVLEKFLRNPDQLPTLGQKAREYAEKYHDYRLIAQQLAGIYESI